MVRGDRHLPLPTEHRKCHATINQTEQIPSKIGTYVAELVRARALRSPTYLASSGQPLGHIPDGYIVLRVHFWAIVSSPLKLEAEHGTESRLLHKTIAPCSKWTRLSPTTGVSTGIS